MTKSEQQEFYCKLGESIKKARNNAKLTQDAFASFLGLHRVSIVNIEKGRQHPPVYMLWDIAKVLGINISEILPEFKQSETIDPKWKKIIAEQSKGNKDTKVKLSKFIEEI